MILTFMQQGMLLLTRSRNGEVYIFKSLILEISSIYSHANPGLQTPHYYEQSALYLEKETFTSSLNLTRFYENPVNRDTF